MAQPFRIGVMQLTMEPLEEMLESARAMDRAGMDTIWLAEAYPWWRKHGMEARSSTVVSALIAKETERLTVGWGIISPFTRHPVQVAMDARVVQEVAGPGRFLLGFGTSKIFLNNARLNGKRTLGPMRDAVEIVRGVLGGKPFIYEGDTWSADVPGLQDEAETPRDVPPVYVAATAPKMQALAGEIGDGCLTPSITTPPFVGYTRENVGRDIDIGCTIVASIHESDRAAGREGAREIARHADQGEEPALAYRFALIASEGAIERYAFAEALSWLDLAATNARGLAETDAVDQLTAEVLETAGWSEAPPLAKLGGPITRGMEREDFDLPVRS